MLCSVGMDADSTKLIDSENTELTPLRNNEGRGLHSSTSQLNLSRFCHKIHPNPPPIHPKHPLNTH